MAGGPAAPASRTIASTSRSERTVLQSLVEELEGTGKAAILGKDGAELHARVDADEIVEVLAQAPPGSSIHAVVVDGPLEQPLVAVASRRGVAALVGSELGGITRRPENVRILTRGDLFDEPSSTIGDSRYFTVMDGLEGLMMAALDAEGNQIGPPLDEDGLNHMLEAGSMPVHAIVTKEDVSQDLVETAASHNIPVVAGPRLENLKSLPPTVQVVTPSTDGRGPRLYVRSLGVLLLFLVPPFALLGLIVALDEGRYAFFALSLYPVLPSLLLAILFRGSATAVRRLSPHRLLSELPAAAGRVGYRLLTASPSPSQTTYLRPKWSLWGGMTLRWESGTPTLEGHWVSVRRLRRRLEKAAHR